MIGTLAKRSPRVTRKNVARNTVFARQLHGCEESSGHLENVCLVKVTPEVRVKDGRVWQGPTTD